MQLQIGVKVIIQNTVGKYLLLTRSEDYQTIGGGDGWDIPGGRIDATEELIAALRREVAEEISIELPADAQPELLAAQDIIVPAKELHVVRLTYRLTLDIDEVTLSGEHTAYRWFTLPELKELSLEPYLAAVVRDM
jgi:8-oxo-dGTP diphosphatase